VQFAMQVVVRIMRIFGIEYLRRGDLVEEAGEGGIAGQEGFGWMAIVRDVVLVVIVFVVAAAVSGVRFGVINVVGMGIAGVVAVAVVTRLDVVGVVKFFFVVITIAVIVIVSCTVSIFSVVGCAHLVGWEDWKLLQR